MLYLVVFEAGMNLVFLAGEVDNNILSLCIKVDLSDPSLWVGV